MKYIVIELQKTAEGQVANLVFSFDTLAEAESKYHSILASAAISTIPVHSAIIVSEEGFPVANKCYKH
jgi:predicted regulator of Ras-like GTPase activity (Roadblock/LC7/MglB family)